MFFETLFRQRHAVRKHLRGPLAVERIVYLERAASWGYTVETLRHKAAYSLGVARALEGWPPDHKFDRADLDALCASWKRYRVRARSKRFSSYGFRNVAKDFLALYGRLLPWRRPPPRHDDLIEDFISAQKERGWQSPVTWDSARGQVRQFLFYMQEQRRHLKTVDAELIDAYFQDVSTRWKRASIKQAANCLRAWFRHCETRGWTKRGLARAVLGPRIYALEAIPLGPSWDDIGRAIERLDGDEPAQLRDRVIMMMLSIYGLRSGELLRLKLDDIDWQKKTLRIVRSKTGRVDVLPLEVSVGNALARYLRKGRHQIDSRAVFVRVRAPHRPMSQGCLYSAVHHRLLAAGVSNRGHGPHGLRHACARRLVEAGLPFKQVGDHLGHRSAMATRIYAKVDLPSLRLVAADAIRDLGDDR